MIIKLDLKIDFVELIKNYIKLLEKLLPNLNYYEQIINENDPKDLCLKYYNLMNRLVDSKPRKVLKSNCFYCPSRFRKLLETIVEKIENGETIIPYLSRGVKRLDQRDLLLDAWGIHHIHLGAQIERDGFIERSGPILFVRFDVDAAYFILIKRHGRRGNRMYDPFIKQILIEIIQKNWSELVERYRFNVELENHLTDDETKQWRKGLINVPVITKNGAQYINPGGGLTLSGDNIQNVRLCYHILKYLENVERFIGETISELIDLVKSYGKEMASPLRFSLISFEFIGLSLVCIILEECSKIHLIFEEGKLPQLFFKK